MKTVGNTTAAHTVIDISIKLLLYLHYVIITKQ